MDAAEDNISNFKAGDHVSVGCSVLTFVRVHKDRRDMQVNSYRKCKAGEKQYLLLHIDVLTMIPVQRMR